MQAAAEAPLAATFYESASGTACLSGLCLYCVGGAGVCGEAGDGGLDGALVLWLPPPLDGLQRKRSPWARTYKEGQKAPWESDAKFCDKAALLLHGSWMDLDPSWTT